MVGCVPVFVCLHGGFTRMILFEIWDLVGFIKVENWDFDFDFGMIVVLTVILLVT